MTYRFANATFKEHYIHISIKETQYFKKSMDDKNYGKSHERWSNFIRQVEKFQFIQVKNSHARFNNFEVNEFRRLVARNDSKFVIVSNLAIGFSGYIRDFRANLRWINRFKIIIYRDELDWLFDFKWFVNRLQTIRKNELVMKGHLKNDFKMEYFECSKVKKIEKSKKIYTDIINY